MSANHTVRNSMTWDNAVSGFIDNNPGRSDSTLARNLAAANGTNVSLGSNSGTITGPRNADGSIPSSSFLRPSDGADAGARF